jgi:CRP-like cAMP-binding protein
MTSKTELKALTALRAAPLTHALATKYLTKMAAIASEVAFEAGEMIYEKGSTGQALYLIRTGEVVIEIDVPGQGRVPINWLGPGQFFGWSSLFPLERKMGWTRAVKPTQAIVFNASRLRAAWQADQGLEYTIIRCAGQDMADRIRAARQQLVEMLEAGPTTSYGTESG